MAGGLAFALFLIGTITVGFCSRFALELFLINEMYRAQQKESQEDKGMDEIEETAIKSVQGRERV